MSVRPVYLEAPYVPPSEAKAAPVSYGDSTLVNAATILGSVPAAMQLRYLQTLTEIGAEQNSTVIFPMPLDVVKPFLQLMESAADASAEAPVERGAARQGNGLHAAIQVPS